MVPAILTSLIPTVGQFLFQKAVKATGAGLSGAVGAPGVVAGIDYASGGALEMTLVGYAVVGLLQGLINFATVYFAPANRQGGGLY